MVRKALVIAVAASAAMSAPSFAQAVSDARPDKASGVTMAEAAIRAELKDPDSAQFQWPYDFAFGTFRVGSKSITGWIICGTVNAKNGFGGYVGSKPAIVVVKDGAPAVALIEPDPRYPIIAKQCSRLGMPVG